MANPIPGNYYIKNGQTLRYITDTNANIGANVTTVAGIGGGPPANGARFDVQQPEAAVGTRTIASIAEGFFVGPGPAAAANQTTRFQAGAFQWTFQNAGPGRWYIRIPAQNRFMFDNGVAGNVATLGANTGGNSSMWQLEAA